MTDDPNARRGREAREKPRESQEPRAARERASAPARTDATRRDCAELERAHADTEEPRVIHLGTRSFAGTNVAADQRERDRERASPGFKSTDRRTTDGPVEADGHDVPEDEWD